jgi:Fic-DOC domain mobile mystery protein B
VGLELEYISGQTPIDEDEKEGLKILSISTRGELDEFEQYNIESAITWSLKQKFGIERILTIEFIKEVHRRMFCDVWDWAGFYRKTNKNIGVDKYHIDEQLVMLLADCNYWIDNRTYGYDELAIRFKHRLVKIHPFPNGNGRHSRLYADILGSHGFNRPIFSWGGKNLAIQSEKRAEYLHAIYQADKGNLEPLIGFARS